MQDSLERLALKLGMLVASSLLEDEVTRLCGPRYERQPHRTHTRYGHQRGTATLAGQKIPIARPRVQGTDGGGEVSMETYVRLQFPDAMPEAVLRRMARGVSTRDYADVIDLTPDGFGVKKSSVSRDFVRASAAQVKALAERRFDGTSFPELMIDGVEYAGETMIVAARITADGTERVLGLRQGATENATVCVALLEDLQARGLDIRGRMKDESERNSFSLQPSTFVGGDADGGAVGRAGGAAADAGDDQPDRAGPLGEAACDGARDPLA